MDAPHHPPPGAAFRTLVGVSAMAASALLVASGAMELVAGRLFPLQLLAGYVALAAMPFVALGLNALQQPRGGWVGLLGAVLFGAGVTGLSAAALYALVTGLTEADLVRDDFGGIYALDAAAFLAGGLLFGASVLRARAFPAWAGIALVAGVVLSGALAGAGKPGQAQALATAATSAAFAGMAVRCLGGGPRERRRGAVESREKVYADRG